MRLRLILLAILLVLGTGRHAACAAPAMAGPMHAMPAMPEGGHHDPCDETSGCATGACCALAPAQLSLADAPAPMMSEPVPPEPSRALPTRHATLDPPPPRG